MSTIKFENMLKEVVTTPICRETASLDAVANALSLPGKKKKRQPDLQYMTCIFVSSGMNKNGAVFMGSELVKARETIPDKAVDIEHNEQFIIGQIVDAAYIKRNGDIFDAETASTSMSVEEMDSMDMDVGVSCIIHKARFPEIATEIMEGKWMVSMEAYYRDYDIKVGDLVIPRDQAEALGYDKLIGQVAHVKDGEKELGFHLVGRVLRDIIFAGVGIVKNPANERSIILEAASMNEYVEQHKENAAVVNLADIGVMDVSTSAKKEIDTKEELASIVSEILREEMQKLVAEINKSINKPEEKAGLLPNFLTPGTCLSYKRVMVEMPNPSTDPLEEPANDLSQYPLSHQPGGDAYPPGTKILAEHYCTLFDTECSARPGDATMPTCWRNVFARTVREEITSKEELLREVRISENLVALQELIDQARTLIQ